MQYNRYAVAALEYLGHAPLNKMSRITCRLYHVYGYNITVIDGYDCAASRSLYNVIIM